MGAPAGGPPDPRGLRPDLPEAVAAAVLRGGLAKEPADRPQSTTVAYAEAIAAAS